MNMKTMQVVKKLDTADYLDKSFASAFSFVSKPCYERRQIDISIDSFLNKKLSLKIDSTSDHINEELMTAIKNSIYTEVETGSWFNLELTDALGKILDTTNDSEKLEYKKYLLNPDNMILIRSSSVTQVSFYFHTRKSLPNKLQDILRQKPLATIANSDIKSQLFLLTSNSFEITLTGFFQIMGQFMRCELK